MRLHIEAMTCGGCARQVTAILDGVDAQGDLEIDVPTKTVTFETDRPTADIQAALAAGGYAATVVA